MYLTVYLKYTVTTIVGEIFDLLALSIQAGGIFAWSASGNPDIRYGRWHRLDPNINMTAAALLWLAIAARDPFAKNGGVRSRFV